MKIFLGLVLMVLMAPQGWSQDLNRLLQRSDELWAARQKKDTAAVARFGMRGSDKTVPMYVGIKEARIVGFSYPDPKSRAKVLVNLDTVVVLPPPLGEIHQAAAELWLWSDGNWYVQTETGSATPFDPLKVSGSAVREEEFKFRLLDRELDLGRHKQGEMVEGLVRFSAPRSQLVNIRARGHSGLRIKNWEWQDENTGVIRFEVDTRLTSKDILQEITFDGVGPWMGFENFVSLDKMSLIVRIEGKVSIAQIPPADIRAGLTQIEIRNIGSEGIRITKIRSLDSVFEVMESVESAIRPGETRLITLRYKPQPAMIDGETLIEFAPGVFPSNNVIFRPSIPGLDASRNSPQPAPGPGGLTREQLDEISRRARPTIPIP